MTYEAEIKRKYSFSGFNMNVGFLWHAWEKDAKRLSLGFVLKTPFTADLEHERYANIESHPDIYESNKGPRESRDSLSLDMPISYGFGVAYRFSDALTEAFDVYRTEWNDFILKDDFGTEISPVTGTCADESDVAPTVQVRAGFEYFVEMPHSRYDVTVLGGAFYDPAPAQGSPDDYYGISAGIGIGTERFYFDAAYQFRYGNDVGKIFLKERDFSQDVTEHSVRLSVIFYFKKRTDHAADTQGNISAPRLMRVFVDNPLKRKAVLVLGQAESDVRGLAMKSMHTFQFPILKFRKPE